MALRADDPRLFATAVVVGLDRTIPVLMRGPVCAAVRPRPSGVLDHSRFII